MVKIWDQISPIFSCEGHITAFFSDVGVGSVFSLKEKVQQSQRVYKRKHLCLSRLS